MPADGRLPIALALAFLAVFAYGVFVAAQPILYALLGIALVAVVSLVRWVTRGSVTQ